MRGIYWRLMPDCAERNALDATLPMPRFYGTGETGADACPFTTLYWDFLARHEGRLVSNPRVKFPYRNLARQELDELRMIRRRADRLKARAAETALLST